MINERNTSITRRLLALSPEDFAWVQSEANEQLLNSDADGIECDYVDFIENALDLVNDPAYR